MGANVPNLPDMVAEWDRDWEATLSPHATQEDRRLFGKMLDQMQDLAHIRFQPYQNDRVPNFVEKLRVWLSQMDASDQRIAFLLASRVVFINQHQFERLQKRLFETQIRHYLIEAAREQHGLALYSYAAASAHLEAEINRTLFIPNTDSSHLNSFTHVNDTYLFDRERRRLIGPAAAFWLYPTRRRLQKDTPSNVRDACVRFENDVLNTHHSISGKQRIVILEDFSGTGCDLLSTLRAMDASALAIDEVVVAPVIATAHAMTEIRSLCAGLSKSGRRRYAALAAFELPQSFRCFDGPAPSYLDGSRPELQLSAKVRDLSEKAYAKWFNSDLDEANKHGFGGLALAFVMYANCPDNSLPILWKQTRQWTPLFRRASRYV